MRSLCRALLVSNLLYCLLAVVQKGLPGWHMFESVESIDHELLDRDGQRIDVREALPRGANLVDRGELRQVVAFVCRHHPERAPFTYAEPPSGLRVTLGDDCKVHAAR